MKKIVTIVLTLALMLGCIGSSAIESEAAVKKQTLKFGNTGITLTVKGNPRYLLATPYWGTDCGEVKALGGQWVYINDDSRFVLYCTFNKEVTQYNVQLPQGVTYDKIDNRTFQIYRKSGVKGGTAKITVKSGNKTVTKSLKIANGLPSDIETMAVGTKPMKYDRLYYRGINGKQKKVIGNMTLKHGKSTVIDFIFDYVQRGAIVSKITYSNDGIVDIAQGWKGHTDWYLQGSWGVEYFYTFKALAKGKTDVKFTLQYRDENDVKKTLTFTYKVLVK